MEDLPPGGRHGGHCGHGERAEQAAAGGGAQAGGGRPRGGRQGAWQGPGTHQGKYTEEQSHTRSGEKFRYSPWFSSINTSSSCFHYSYLSDPVPLSSHFSSLPFFFLLPTILLLVKLCPLTRFVEYLIQVKEAKDTCQSIFEHKPKIQEIILKYQSKRSLKRRRD